MITRLHDTPGLNGDIFITDGGLETFMIMKEGWQLPGFAAFVLLESEVGSKALVSYYERYLTIARRYLTGFILESPTWRANPSWMERLGYPKEALTRINQEAIGLLHRIRERARDVKLIRVSGCVGPRDDGYRPLRKMTAEQAEEFHTPQISAFRIGQPDLVSGFTINYVEEAVGIVNAAGSQGLPAVISFTVETDGRLPSGQTLKEAIQEVDDRTDRGAAYFMVNCSHPTHIRPGLEDGGVWLDRIRGVRANASRMSHEELDQAQELDEGDPGELAREYVAMRETLPNLQFLGGCCGTDDRHIEEICRAYLC